MTEETMHDHGAREPAHDRDIDFPEVRQARMERDALQAYVGDLKNLPRVDELQLKGASETYADEADVDLERAFELLISGAVRGLQIRYVWEGESWWDTLIRTPEGIELTRIQPPEISADEPREPERT